jgi:hypothetical protein
MDASEIIDLARSMGLILGLAFFVAIVIWTYKDARKRTDDPILVSSFTAISMLPVFGVLIYMLVRPSEYLADVRERELEIRALERQLGRQERCPYCKSHIEGDYLSCPVCTTKLRQSCTGCERPLDPRWVMCPFCETEVPSRGGRGPAGPDGGGARRATPKRDLPAAESTAPREEPAKRPIRSASSAATKERPRDRDRGSSRDASSARPSSKPASKPATKPASTDAPAKDADIRTEPFGAGDTTRI